MGARCTCSTPGSRSNPNGRRLYARRAQGWMCLRPETAPWLQAPSTEAATSIPRKLLFGSDFPYREASAHLRLHSEAVGLEPSFAFGGHSNIWGAAVMPYVDRDMAGWPICARELAPHYEACARMLEFSAEEDDLAEEFPLYSTPPGEVAASSQARSLLHTMARNRVRLAAPITSFSRRPHRSTRWQGMALHTLSQIFMERNRRRKPGSRYNPLAGLFVQFSARGRGSAEG